MVMGDDTDALLVEDLMLHHAQAGGVHVVGSPVTDTIKVVRDGVVDRTLDRDRLVRLGLPAVLSRETASELPDPRAGDACAWIVELSRRPDFRWWEASARAGRRDR